MTYQEHKNYCNGELEPTTFEATECECDTCGYHSGKPNRWNTEDYGPEPKLLSNS